MKIDNHLRKAERLEKSVLKLDSPADDYEALVELYMLIAAHYINAALHQIGALNISKDVKHNRIFSFLIESKHFGEETVIVRDLIKKLDDLRPSHIYGKGENGNTAKKAQEYYLGIKNICERFIHERKS